MSDRRTIFSNSNGVTFGTTGGTVTASHNGLTSQSTQYLALTLGGNTAGTTTFHASNNASLFLHGGPNITLSGSGSSVTISGGAGGAGDGVNIIAAGTRTAQTTGTVLFDTGNGITFGLNAVGGSVITASHNGLTSQSTDFNAITLGGNTAGTTTFHATNNRTIFLHGGNNITLSGNGSSITISAGAGGGGIGGIAVNALTTYTSGTVVFSNSNGVTFGTNAQTITASVNSTSNVGLNTAQTNVTWTVNSAGISLNASGYAGTGTSATNATLTLNSNGLAISVAAPGGGAGATISSYENQIGGLFNSQTQSCAQSTSIGVVFQMPQAISASFLRLPIALVTASTAIASTASSASASGEVYHTFRAVMYSLGVGASSKSLISVASGSGGATFRNSVSIQTNGSQYSITQQLTHLVEGGTTTTSTQYSASSSVLPLSTTFFSAAFTGSRWLDVPFANSMSAGPYWMLFGISTSSNTNSTRLTALTNCRLSYGSHYGMSQPNSNWGIMGSTNLSSGGLLGAGSFTTAGGGTTSAFPISAITSSASNVRMYFQLLRSA